MKSISVPIELLEDTLNPCADFATHERLRAILDKPSECRCKRYGKDNPHWPCPVHTDPAAQHQDSNPGWPDPLESTLEKEIINNPSAFDLAIRDLFDKLCREIQAGRYYRRFSGSEPMEFTANQVEPVAWRYKKSWEKTGWKFCDKHPTDYGIDDECYEIQALYAEQPAPAADQAQCEECKGWGYHENHHEGGGTECGECGGSGNAPVALVMPERLNTEGGYSLEAETWYNLALDDVASLNGVTK